MKVFVGFLAIILCKVLQTLAVGIDRINLNAANQNPKTGPFCCKPGVLLSISSSINDLLIIYSSDDYHGGHFSFLDFMYANLLILVTDTDIKIDHYVIGRSMGNKHWKHSVKNGLHGGIKAYIECINIGFFVYLQENYNDGDSKTTSLLVPYGGDVTKHEFWVLGEVHEGIDFSCQLGNVNYNEMVLPYELELEHEATRNLVPGEVKLMAYVTHRDFLIDFTNVFSELIVLRMDTNFDHSKVKLNRWMNSWGDDVASDHGKFPFSITPKVYEICFIFSEKFTFVFVDGKRFMSFPDLTFKVVDGIKIKTRDGEESEFNVLGLSIILHKGNFEKNWISKNESPGPSRKEEIKVNEDFKKRKLMRSRKGNNKSNEMGKLHAKNASNGKNRINPNMKKVNKGKKRQNAKKKNHGKGKKGKKFRMKNSRKGNKRKTKQTKNAGKTRRNLKTNKAYKGKKRRNLKKKNFNKGKKSSK